MADTSLPENIRFAKHKDWGDNFIYQHNMLCRLDPVVQALSAPLHLMAQPGRVCSVPALSAQLSHEMAALKALHSRQELQAGAKTAKAAADLSQSLAKSLEFLRARFFNCSISNFVWYSRGIPYTLHTHGSVCKHE